MTKRFSLISILFLIGAGLLVPLVFGAYHIFLSSFIALEHKEMVRNVEQLKEQVANEVDQLATIAADYSGWDDAYNFIEKGNPAFIRTSLDDAIFPQLRLNLLLYLDRSGAMRYGKAFSVADGKECPIPPALLDLLRSDRSLLADQPSGTKKGGIMTLPDGLLLMAYHPVLKSDFTGPAVGLMAVGRYFTESELKRLSQRLHLSAEMVRFDKKDVSPDFALASATLRNGTTDDYLVTPHGDAVHGYSLFRDLGGIPAFLMRVSAPRDIYRGGLQTINFFFILALMVTFPAGILSYFFIRKRQKMESRYHSVVHNAAEGIVLLEMISFSIIEANEAFLSFLGESTDGLIGKSLLGWIPMEKNTAREALLEAFSDKKEIHFRHADGSLRVAELMANHIPDQGIETVALIVHDTTERRQLEEQLFHHAYHDVLTGLPNRNLLNDRLQQGMADTIRQQRCLSLAILDLDNFKLVNDNLGHATGDRLLVKVAERLRSCCRATDTLARLGGDEFVLLSTLLQRPDDAIGIIEQVHAKLEEPFLIDGRNIYVTATIGIAQFPQDSSSAEDLMCKADVAMYHIKSGGKNGFGFFNEEMNRNLRERIAIENQLRQAVERNELALHYQPKISLVDGTICGVEALLRWNNSELGQVPPARFIPVAEETGLILPIGEWVLYTAARQLVKWQAEGLPVPPVAINISAIQLAHPELVGAIRDALDKTGLEPGMLQLEVTETMIMQNVEESTQRMSQLKKLGIDIGMDDFGTGYSSLAYINQFPIDSIKIDRSFISEITIDPAKKSIVRLIVIMAHNMGLKVVAEGVETMEQMEFVREKKCEELQGFLFSHPLTAAEFQDLLNKWDPAAWETNLQTRRNLLISKATLPMG